jgi:hypothetical protein
MNMLKQASLLTFVALATLCVITSFRPVAAQVKPCKTAAPTTPDVNLFVADLDRSVDWYRKNTGLEVDSRWLDFGRGGVATVRLKRGNAGVTLLYAPARGKTSDPQVLCLVIDGLSTPSGAQSSTYLEDPDGTSVELVVGDLKDWDRQLPK